jgi:hypothetical protein
MIPKPPSFQRKTHIPEIYKKYFKGWKHVYMIMKVNEWYEVMIPMLGYIYNENGWNEMIYKDKWNEIMIPWLGYICKWFRWNIRNYMYICMYVQ